MNRYQKVVLEAKAMRNRERERHLRRYSPPGSPDIDDGFRVLATPAGSRRTSARVDGKPPPSAKLARRRPVTSTHTRETSRVQGSTGMPRSRSAHYASSERVECGSDVTEVRVFQKTSPVKDTKAGIMREARLYKAPSPPSDTKGTHTCSNQILNMRTIDDSLPQFRRRNQQTNDSNSSAETSRTLTRPSSSVTSTRQDVSKRSQRVHSAPMSRTKTRQQDEERPLSRNKAVDAAFDTFERCKTVTHNSAHRGLFTHEQLQRPKRAASARESPRFRKLNRALRNKMAEHHLHGSELAQKIELRKLDESPQPALAEHQDDVTHESDADAAPTISFTLAGNGTGSTVPTDSPERFINFLMATNSEGDRPNSTLLHTFVYV